MYFVINDINYKILLIKSLKMKSRSELIVEIKSKTMIADEDIVDLIIKYARECHIQKDYMLSDLIDIKDEKSKINEDISATEEE